MKTRKIKSRISTLKVLIYNFCLIALVYLGMEMNYRVLFLVFYMLGCLAGLISTIQLDSESINRNGNLVSGKDIKIDLVLFVCAITLSILFTKNVYPIAGLLSWLFMVVGMVTTIELIWLIKTR